MAYDAAQKWVMWVGLIGSAACCYLGYPCAVSWGIEASIRGTCVAYGLCQALPLLLGPTELSKGLLRLGLLAQSAALWLGSCYWPLGRGVSTHGHRGVWALEIGACSNSSSISSKLLQR